MRALERHPEALIEIERFDKEAPPELKSRVPKLSQLIADERAHVVAVVACNVKGARILVRDKLVAAAPIAAPLRLNAGRATVEVSADGFEPFRRTYELPGGGSMTIDAQLQPKEKKGILVVNTSLEGARAFVDGKSGGESSGRGQCIRRRSSDPSPP